MRNSNFRCLSKTPSCAALHTNNSSLALTALAAALDQAACDWSRPQLNLEYSALIGRHKTNTASYWSGPPYHICSLATSIHLAPGLEGRRRGRKNGLLESKYVTLHPVLPVCVLPPALGDSTRQITHGVIPSTLDTYIQNHLPFTHRSRNIQSLFSNLCLINSLRCKEE